MTIDAWGLAHCEDDDRAVWLAAFMKVTAAYEKSVEHETKVWLQDGKVSEAYLDAVESRLQAYWLWKAWLQAYNGYMEWLEVGRPRWIAENYETAI